MIDAMQISVSSEIAKRIDDNNSTASRKAREPLRGARPEGDKDMAGIIPGQAARNAKGRSTTGPWQQAKRPGFGLAQTGHVVADGLDFLVAHARGDGHH